MGLINQHVARVAISRCQLLGEEESSWSDEPLEAFTSAAARVALMLLWDTKKLYLPRIMLTAVFGVLILWKETRAVHTRK